MLGLLGGAGSTILRGVLGAPGLICGVGTTILGGALGAAGEGVAGSTILRGVAGAAGLVSPRPGVVRSCDASRLLCMQESSAEPVKPAHRLSEGTEGVVSWATAVVATNANSAA